MKKSNIIILAVALLVVAISVGMLVYFVMLGFSGHGEETASNTESSSETMTSSEESSSTEETTGREPLPAHPDKRIALTFDDGPSLSVTPQILDILEKYHASATFFAVGYNLTDAKMPSIRRALALGCEIGNHSDSHSHLTELSDEEILREIRETNQKITELSCSGYVPTLMRPPGGHIDARVMNVLYESGVRMHTIMWNSDSRDWEFNKKWQDGEISFDEAVESAVALVLSEAEDGGIVLMHDIKEITPAVLECVLKELSEKGYAFVTVSELFDFESMGEDAYFSEFYADGHIVKIK